MQAASIKSERWRDDCRHCDSPPQNLHSTKQIQHRTKIIYDDAPCFWQGLYLNLSPRCRHLRITSDITIIMYQKFSYSALHRRQQHFTTRGYPLAHFGRFSKASQKRYLWQGNSVFIYINSSHLYFVEFFVTLGEKYVQKRHMETRRPSRWKQRRSSSKVGVVWLRVQALGILSHSVTKAKFNGRNGSAGSSLGKQARLANTKASFCSSTNLRSFYKCPVILRDHTRSKVGDHYIPGAFNY